MLASGRQSGIKWAPLVVMDATQAAQPAAVARLAAVSQPVVVPDELDGSMKSQRFDAAQPRRKVGGARASSTPLVESVELTPGGRRKHVLQRSSPGGSVRSSQYISPSRAEIMDHVGSDEDDLREQTEMERWRRRGVAVEEVACQQNDAQRSAASRAKRKAEEPLTPSDWLPSDAVLPDDVILSVDQSAATQQYKQKQYAAKRRESEKQLAMVRAGLEAGKQMLDAIDRGHIRCPTYMTAHAVGNAVHAAQLAAANLFR
jgi:hypothetical protein